MSIEHFFRHDCDIFSVTYDDVASNYSLPTGDKKASYPQKATFSGVKCFFGNSNTSPRTLLSEPVNEYGGYDEISLPIDIPIKRGDKIIDLRFNIAYTAGFPEDIRGKYISVPLEKSTGQERL